MDCKDLCIDNENNDIKQGIAENDLSFGSFIVTSPENKLSVTAKYVDEDSRTYVTLDKDFSIKKVDEHVKKYYGISPLFDYEMITEAISGFKLTNPEALDKYISEHSDLFMMHEDQSAYLLDFARYIVTSVVSIFSVKLQLSLAEAEAVMELDDFCKETADWDMKNKILTIHGCPTDAVLEVLSPLHFTKGKKHVWISDPAGDKTLKDIYSETENITLTNGKVFYSGTLIKPTHLSHPHTRYEDNGVSSVIIEFEKTTYATVFALDNNFTRHPLLKKCKKAIVSLLQQDDKEKSILIDRLETSGISDQDRFAAVNEYLGKCFNPNQIGVSGNIVTSDNVLLFTHRGADTIDCGSIYPGVNGNAEIADENVSFYKKSMYEDYPTIYLEKYRMDFLGEINRETYAELNLDLKEEDWSCCGVFISGTRPPEATGDEEYGAKRRRLHFNILFEQNIEKSFWEIDQKRQHATEKFESDSLMGLKIRCHNNPVTAFFSQLLSAFRKISQLSDTWESVLLLLMFGLALFGQQTSSDPRWYTVITIVLAVIIVVATIFDAVEAITKFYHLLKRSKKLFFYKNMTLQEKNKKISSIMNNYSYHPITYAALELFVDNQMREKLFKEKE